MAERNYVDLLVRILNASAFVRDAKKMREGVKGVGDETEQTGKKAGTSLKQLAKWAASAYIFQKAASYLKGAVDESVNLAKSSLQLTRLTGLDVKQASEWVVVAQQRGIESQRLGIMFTQLGRAQQRALAGSKAQAQAFAAVGINVTQLRSMNATQLVESISDAFAAMPNGLQKAALAQQFFGRTGRQLLPILNQGGASLQEQLDLVEHYGAALEGKTATDIQRMIKRQRELKLAQLGVKEQLADALIPTLMALSGVMQDVLRVIAPLTKNQTAMQIVLVALTAVWVVYTAAQIGATVATWNFKAALIGSGVGLALIALAVIIVLVVKHWGAIKAAMQSAVRTFFVADQAVRNGIGAGLDWLRDKLVALLGWIRGNWQSIVIVALTGPFGLAFVLIKRHFGSLVHFVEWAAGKIRHAVGTIAEPLHWVTSTLSSIAGSIPGAAAGGTVTRSGMVLVGERGPELLSLPQRAQVRPLERSGGGGGGGRGGGDIHVTIPVLLDGREVTRAVWKHTADEAARR